jgi:hypothetical protein
MISLGLYPADTSAGFACQEEPFLASMPAELTENAHNPSFRSATRIQESFVAALERNTLGYLAVRTPAWISSDQLTILGFVSQCSAGLCYRLPRSNPDALLVGILCLVFELAGRQP